MNPEKYEEFVAKHFEAQGYRVTRTPISNDYGVDIIVEKGDHRLAIQVKMYGGTTRKVNHAMVMELNGAMKYARCDAAAVVTDGHVLPDAQTVAADLGIDIMFLPPNDHSARSTPPDKHAPLIHVGRSGKLTSFDSIWQEYILNLAGKTIYTKTGRANKILSVDWGGVHRITSKGLKAHIPIEPFRFAVQRLLSSGNVTRADIDLHFHKERCSSGVFAILAQVPMFVVSETGAATLSLRK